MASWMCLLRHHRTHRHRARGQALGGGHEVRHDVEILGRRARAQAAEGGDHLVEDQQDAVLLGDRAQALQVAHRRRVDADRAGDRLDDHRGDGRGVVQRHQPLQRVGELGAVLGQAAAEAVLLQVERVRQVVDAGQQRAEEHPVLDHAADRDAAEADAVIAALAADQPGARALADGALVGERDLERGVDRFRAGIGEEGVVEVAREQMGELRGELERLGMAPLEAGREVELGRLAWIASTIRGPRGRHCSTTGPPSRRAAAARRSCV